jgi:hypothetical protein
LCWDILALTNDLALSKIYNANVLGYLHAEGKYKSK